MRTIRFSLAAILLITFPGCESQPAPKPAAGAGAASKPGTGGATAADGAATESRQAGPPRTKPAEGSGGRLFAVTFQTMGNPFFVDLAEGLRKVIEANGDRLQVLDARFDSLQQRNGISDVLARKPAALFINPVNWEGIKSSLTEAKRKGVPVIIVDAPAADPELALCTVASDNVLAGRLAGEALAKANPNAKVVILHLSVNKACLDRVTGFKEAIAKFPGIKLLDTQEGGGMTDKSRPVMRDMLGRFADLDAVFPINDPSARGAISAIEAAGRAGKVTVVSVDGSDDGIRDVKDGKMLSTSAQFPKEIGRIAAEKAYDHLAGKPVEKDVKVKVELITKENAPK